MELEYERDGAEIYRRSFATIRAEADLGWQPSVGLREGLRSQFDWVSARRATLAPVQAVPQTA